MRLPLFILPQTSAEEATRHHPGFRVILNTAAPPGSAMTLNGCVCCAGRNDLRDALNSIYIEWAHDRSEIKGAIIIPGPEAEIGDLCDFLEDDLMLRARFAVQNEP